ncbi:MAG: hypothetical protein [Siphoviridae sp. ctpQM7]|nr:MAG: hypothetical protein [Siphoviridae sp. ctpQM7]
MRDCRAFQSFFQKSPRPFPSLRHRRFEGG